ncbi:PIN domain-containing protein [Microbispora sp. ATCC PTA-5024]|uniref:PIN domain-containing protein n=1 Tax=Microbispora sp. ATCC PTA-5024 TaxID=316330 RepID=UPI0003DCE624|nr:PIN domain-containing protein [Microbispora sp. ATCC PTA-5024]ETK31804.1 hypothetical protein MPTA5024_33095 [Microbispora sp. ATCC PTA-5024]
MTARPAPARFVLDTGALVQLERGDEVVLDILARAAEGEVEIVVPRTVVAEVWRGGPRQARLAALLKSAVTARFATVTVDELTPERARQIGRTVARCGHDDIVDVNVALCARSGAAEGRVDAIVVTTDRDDIVRVDESLNRAILAV